MMDFNGFQIDVTSLSRLQRPPYKRNWVKQQLFSGHLRVDMAQPMSQGTFIIFKGDKRSSGKQDVAISTISQFLKESP